MPTEFDTKYVRYTKIDQHLVVAAYKPTVPKITEPISREIVLDRLALNMGSDLLVLVKNETGVSFTSAAMKYLSSHEGQTGLSAAAVLLHRWTDALLGRFLIKIKRPGIDTNLFTNEADARAWLKWRYFHHSLERHPEALLVIDKNGLLTNANHHACSLLGFSKEQLLGKTMHGLSEGNVALSPMYLRRHMSSFGLEVLPVKFLKASSGIDIPVQLTLTPVKEGWSKQREMLIIVKDLSLTGILATVENALETTPCPQEQKTLSAAQQLLKYGPRKVINLTPREKEILPLIALGLTSKEISLQLNCSDRTVENHRASMCKKFGENIPSELIARAREWGYL
jgi:PAS domain S-box-containing protein